MHAPPSKSSPDHQDPRGGLTFLPRTTTARDPTLLSIRARCGARSGVDAEVPATGLGEVACPVAGRQGAERL